MSATIQNTVQNHLRKLASVRDAQRLFTELNYTRDDAPLSRHGWPTDANAALAEDPAVIAHHGDFRVIYSRLKGNSLNRTDERAIVTQLTKQHPTALYLFSDANASEWHFLNVKYDDDETRRRVYRRFTVGEDERFGDRLRTISDQLAKVAIADNEIDRVTPLELQERYDRAFDVEAVTKDFYRRYASVFTTVEASINGFDGDKESRRLFAQKLFNRIMFLAFIQKKGWLNFPGQQGTDYLSRLWVTYSTNREAGDNFYRDRLQLLFKAKLDTPHGNRPPQGTVIDTLVGSAPYLNGGLFEEDADDRRDDIIVPDTSINLILSGLFDRYNFTVAESTPLDVEVAIDPEMLGKVFEELVTGRHESGSYYTPKPIVSFMCREALKVYLGTVLPDEDSTAIQRFVDDYDPSSDNGSPGIRDPEAVLGALRVVTACDPACGSGAYLLGLLHELLELRQALFSVKQVDPISNYNRKLEIIQNNIYGVDIDPFAVNIARLRLWLSLTVEFEGANPPPLPNLDFKIEEGNSLTAPVTHVASQITLRKEMIAEFQQLKRDYMTAHSDVKRNLEQRINELRAELAIWVHGGGDAGGFDWPVEFAEVLANGGFNIALANPPYVRYQLSAAQRPRLEQVFGPLYSGTADLYVYFYYRSIQILGSRGVLAFISSNKWLRSAYGAKLRKYLSSEATILSITDFGELPVFETAATDPLIIIARKSQEHTLDTRYTKVPNLLPPYPDVRRIIESYGYPLDHNNLIGPQWMFATGESAATVRQMERDTVSLQQYTDDQIYLGVKTGLNAAYVIDGIKRLELIDSDPSSADIIRPMITGKAVERWRVESQDRWLIAAKIGVPIHRYPAIHNHLRRWREQLESRTARGNEWWELRPCAYYHAFEQSKIILPDITSTSRFAIHREPIFTGDTTFVIPIEDYYLLAILNSSSLWSYARERLAVLGNADQGGRLRFQRHFVTKLPIPLATAADRHKIAVLAQQCVDKSSGGAILTSLIWKQRSMRAWPVSTVYRHRLRTAVGRDQSFNHRQPQRQAG